MILSSRLLFHDKLFLYKISVEVQAQKNLGFSSNSHTQKYFKQRCVEVWEASEVDPNSSWLCSQSKTKIQSLLSPFSSKFPSTVICALSRKLCSLENNLNQFQFLPQQKPTTLPEDIRYLSAIYYLRPLCFQASRQH